MECEICKAQCVSKQRLSAHVKRVHNIDFKTYYDEYIKTPLDGVCKTCGGSTVFYKGVYRDFCSVKCSNNNSEVLLKMSNSIKNTLEAKTEEQWEKIYDKRKKTVLERYSVENISQKGENREKKRHNCYWKTTESREKLKKVNWNKIREKINKTNLTKYGHTAPSKNKIVSEKISNTKKIKFYEDFERFSHIVVPLFQISEYEGGKQKPYQWKCSICGKIFTDYIIDGKLPRCLECNPKIKSNLETMIVNFLKENNIEYKQNDRTVIKPLEVDFLIPKFNLAIEVNGLYWHSELSGVKNKKYHLEKHEKCLKAGITLIQIFEDELLFNSDIVFSKLSQVFGLINAKVYARNCVVRPVDFDTKKQFLEKNHLQGNDVSSLYLGLYNNGRLFSVMTFSKNRKSHNSKNILNHWELSRFCSLKNFIIVGGASKLLKYFETQYNPQKIITYADRRWSKGSLYQTLGFTFTHFSKPSYWYFKYGYFDRVHRFNFKKNTLHSKLKIFDPLLTEWENMQINGYDRIWDCGTFVFEKNYPTKNAGGAVSANP